MRSTKGFIKTDRNIIESGLFTAKGKNATFKLFFLLLTMATHGKSKREVVFDNRQILLEINQLLTGTDELVEQTSLSKNTIIDGLDWLHDNGYIKMVTCNDRISGRLITILKTYGIDGKSSEGVGQIMVSEVVRGGSIIGTSAGISTDPRLVSEVVTLKNYKNDNKENKDKTIKKDTFVTVYKSSSLSELKTSTDCAPSIPSAPIDKSILSDAFYRDVNPSSEDKNRYSKDWDEGLFLKRLYKRYDNNRLSYDGRNIFYLVLEMLKYKHRKSPKQCDPDEQGRKIDDLLKQNGLLYIREQDSSPHGIVPFDMLHMLQDYVVTSQFVSGKELQGDKLAQYIIDNHTKGLAKRNKPLSPPTNKPEPVIPPVVQPAATPPSPADDDEVDRMLEELRGKRTPSPM